MSSNVQITREDGDRVLVYRDPLDKQIHIEVVGLGPMVSILVSDFKAANIALSIDEILHPDGKE